MSFANCGNKYLTNNFDLIIMVALGFIIPFIQNRQIMRLIYATMKPWYNNNRVD